MKPEISFTFLKIFIPLLSSFQDTIPSAEKPWTRKTHTYNKKQMWIQFHPQLFLVQSPTWVNWQKKKKKKSLGKRFFSPKMFHMLIKDSVRGLAFNDEMLIKPLWFLPQSVIGFDKNLISILIRNYFSSELWCCMCTVDMRF